MQRILIHKFTYIRYGNLGCRIRFFNSVFKDSFKFSRYLIFLLFLRISKKRKIRNTVRLFGIPSQALESNNIHVFQILGIGFRFVAKSCVKPLFFLVPCITPKYPGYKLDMGKQELYFERHSSALIAQ